MLGGGGGKLSTRPLGEGVQGQAWVPWGSSQGAHPGVSPTRAYGVVAPPLRILLEYLEITLEYLRILLKSICAAN